MINRIKQDFDGSFYICRMPPHIVGPGIPFNCGSIYYPAEDEDLIELRDSILHDNPGVDSDELVIWKGDTSQGVRITILNLSRRRFNFTRSYPVWLKGRHTYTAIVPFRKIH